MKNILFIICDDLNLAVSGMGSTPFAPTPNLERLAGRGVRFTNAHCNSPLCLPSRNSLFSGIYPHGTGHFTLWDHWRSCTPIATTNMAGFPNMGEALLKDAVMTPLHFKRHGYGVFGAGKTFHQGQTDPNWWTEYHGGQDYGPFPFGASPDKLLHDVYEGDPFEAYVNRYQGLDRFFLDGRKPRHGIEMSFEPLDEICGDPDQPATHWGGRPYRYVNDEDRDPLPDEATINYGIEVLNRSHPQPFFLTLGLMKPHTPLNVPRKYYERFPLEEIALPPILEGDTDDCARAHVEHFPYGFTRYRMIAKDGEERFRKFLQAYLACIAFVDDQVGRLLKALEASPHAENTLVVFTSDNGHHLGEKEFIFKNTLWQESSGIPLIVRGPGIAPGTTCDRPVSLIDLYPTFIDYAGLPAEPNTGGNERRLDGHSLRPLLERPENPVWDGPPVALTSVRGDTGIHHSVVSQFHRYTLCQNGEEELYDHRNDPHEWHNLAADPASAEVKSRLREEWMKLVFYENQQA